MGSCNSYSRYMTWPDAFLQLLLVGYIVLASTKMVDVHIAMPFLPGCYGGERLTQALIPT